MSDADLLFVHRIAAALSVLVIIALVWRNIRLRQEREQLRAHRGLLQAAVFEARQTFARYAKLHFAKRTDEGYEKGRANHDLEKRMAAALSKTGYVPLTPLQQTFAHFGKQADDLWRRPGSIMGVVEKESGGRDSYGAGDDEFPAHG